jgi:DNA-binding NtrC family response regulator
MAYRLLVTLGDRVHRFSLEPGELSVGSSADCTVKIPHPAVSRRHARLHVDATGVAVEDLGSRNGTRVDGVVINDRVPLLEHSALQLGSVHARLEQVEERDLDVAIALPKEPAPPDAGVVAPPSTIGPAVVESFALRELPELADAVARGEDRIAVAQAVGAALYQSLPCAWVEVTNGSDGVVFEAHRDASHRAAAITVDAGEGRDLKVELLHPSHTQSFAPLVRTAAALIRAATPTDRKKPRRTVDSTTVPELPAPPTLDPEVRRIYSQAGRIANSRIGVLILGESGTGKELLARYLHAASDRADSPLVALNCAALPRDLLEAELFGVERGVATGVEPRPGKFEAAHKGTLFLDEIGDMSLETQARILRVLECGEVHRLGGQTPRPADLRVISATNRDLDTLLEEGRFRPDLYHRIANWVVTLPPLRQRRADIPNLAAHFLIRTTRERGVRAVGISRAAVDALVGFHWPGNVRQLEKEMERAALFLEDDELLDTALLQPEIAAGGEDPPSEALHAVRECAEREHIRRVIDDCNGALPEAAARLEIGLSTLYAKLKALGIET